ncbi:hypothetical protein KP509_14G049500 [Ceratopteris richardii]|nr:hypothetical protein KP509_14G049500 [Ceratopteris richardii]
MFLDEETAESLQSIGMVPDLCSPRLYASMQRNNINLPEKIDRTSSRVPVYAASLSGHEVDCVSLYDVGMSSESSITAMNTLRSLPLCETGENSAVSSVEPIPSMVPLSLKEESLSNPTTVRGGIQIACSSEMVTPNLVISPQTSPPDFLSGDSDSGLLCNLAGNSVPLAESEFARINAVEGKEGSTASRKAFGSSNASALQTRHAPSSLHRSQSSHSLGQLAVHQCSISHSDDGNTSTVCEQEVTPCISFSNPLGRRQSAESRGFCHQHVSMRRVYSTGDLQFSCGVKVENMLKEEASGTRTGHYTVEERRMKLHRYRQKRTERNFNKKIKYACRKTLADNRPRVRGRFARNDEMGESIAKISDLLGHGHEYERSMNHHSWMVQVSPD